MKLTTEEKSGKTRRRGLLAWFSRHVSFTYRTTRSELRSWFLKHVLLVFFFSFISLFAYVNFYQVLYSISVEESLQANLIMSSTLGVVFTMLWNGSYTLRRRSSGDLSTSSTIAKDRREIPLSLRLSRRKYDLLLFYCFALLAGVNSVFFVRAGLISIIGFVSYLLFIVSLQASIHFLKHYLRIVQNTERAVFYLRSFSKKLEKDLDGKKRRIPPTKLLSDGFRYYEKSLASPFKLKSIGEKLGQAHLVLERGSKVERKKLLSIFQKVVDAVEKENHEKFDTLFIELGNFLNTYVSAKQGIMEFGRPTRKRKTLAFLSQLAKPISEKVIPWLIILAIVALIYYLSGIQIPPLNP